tara:strand:- start:465 stop:938 length:474 start_codon:yes stop_codon:yes gene_type:complete
LRVSLVRAARTRQADQENLTMTEGNYEEPDTAQPGSARDLLAKFDKIENPNSPGRKPKSPKQKAVGKDIYKPQNLGETPAAGKGVSSNPFLQMDKDHKKKVKEETPTTAGVFASKASDSAKASGLAIKSWSSKLVKGLTNLPVCAQIREKSGSTDKK